MTDTRKLSTETEAALIAANNDLRKVLQEGCDLVESAYSHISHGGPTREDASAWIEKAKQFLGGR